MTLNTDQIDQAFVQSQFPGLKSDWVFFDNAGGSQTVRGAIDRITGDRLPPQRELRGQEATFGADDYARRVTAE